MRDRLFRRAWPQSLRWRPLRIVARRAVTPRMEEDAETIATSTLPTTRGIFTRCRRPQTARSKERARRLQAESRRAEALSPARGEGVGIAGRVSPLRGADRTRGVDRSSRRATIMTARR
jgi:hypothetical protein